MKLSSVKLTFCILLGCLSLRSHAQDWPQWRGINRDGKATGVNLPQTWPQQLQQVWKVSVGSADASPVLVNNALYVFTRQNGNEVLQCLDAATGKLNWQSEAYPTPQVTGPAAPHPGPRSTPAISSGKVVTVGVAGDIACFDAGTGKIIWRNEEYKGAVPQFYTSMSPVISGGIVYTHLGGPQTGSFVAFDLATGTVIWKTAGEGPAYGSPVVMAIDGKNLLVFQSQTKIVGLDPGNGAQLWEITTPVGTGRVNNAATPVVDQQKLYYTGMNNGVNAVEIKKQGQEYVINKLWTNAEFNPTYNTPVLKDGFLYGLSGLYKLFCINATDGKTAWVDAVSHQSFGSIIDAGSVMIALSSTSNLVVYKADSQAYSQIALYKVADTPVYAHPVLSGNRIYVKDNEFLMMYMVN